MINNTRLKIALISPLISGHKHRGTGKYTDKLYESLQKVKDVEVKLINIKDQVQDFDLIHYPYFDPFFLTLPLIKRKPTIVTVHDLIPLKFPQHFPVGIKGKIKWQLQKASLTRTSRIITDSYSSKEDIVKFANIPSEKIEVIYLGVDNEFRIIKERNILERIREKFQLPKQFILNVGDINYNKNIPNLVKAFCKIRASYPETELVLVGEGFVKQTNQLDELKRLLDNLKLTSCVHRIGHVDLDSLVGFYNLAALYVQSSLAEGFGLPVLEAMSCGCPTVVTNITSLSELVGTASIQVNPYEVDSIAEGMTQILSDNISRKKRIEKGLNQAKLFSWEKCAGKTLEIYKKVLKKS